jgi:organic hydroperoxide reductase OsmC/OhrA
MSQYTVSARVQPENLVALTAAGLPDLESGPPKEFGGSGEQWSPEDLLVAAVADCFALSFRAIAGASKFTWIDLNCSVTGTLDKVERNTQFTEFEINVVLKIPGDSDASRAQRLLEKAEQTCFITNSLKAKPKLTAQIETA